jgi:hypothetical protein
MKDYGGLPKNMVLHELVSTTVRKGGDQRATATRDTHFHVVDQGKAAQ